MIRIAFLLISFLSIGAFAQENPGLTWSRDLQTAFEDAASRGKILLLRQIVCGCSEKTCALEAIATRPWYADDPKARPLIDARFLPVLVHVAPEKRDEGLVDPGVMPKIKDDRPLPVRTVFVMPNHDMIHRLDLCAYSSDVAAELQFAIDLRDTCYEKDGTLSKVGKDKFIGLHWIHSLSPQSIHRSLKVPVAQECGCRPPAEDPSISRRTWPGYRRGILWHTDMDEAQRLAKASGKLVLYYQIVGDMNKEGC